jgi:hypothetical protein
MLEVGNLPRARVQPAAYPSYDAGMCCGEMWATHTTPAALSLTPARKLYLNLFNCEFRVQLGGVNSLFISAFHGEFSFDN